MNRLLLTAFLLAGTTFAIAQTTPGPQQNPMQPGAPQAQPGATPMQPGTDPTSPNAVPGAPPAFVPGMGGADDGAAMQPRVLRISGGVMAGSLVSKVDPVYPDDARAAHLEGSVVMAARIGHDGHVTNLSVISGPQPLQAAAVDAVKQWVYKPYMLNGQPVEVSTTITVNFSLQQ